jgi:Kunitz/Bovine pancreatic trypsin inhibitor domain/von Willebrand factor type C domain
MRPNIRPPFVSRSSALVLAAALVAPACGDEVIDAARDAGGQVDSDAAAAPAADGGSLRDASTGRDADAPTPPADAGPDASSQADAASVDSDASFPARCALPPESGACLAYIPRWAFDPARGACTRFVWGGCGGNENNFERPTDCLDACLGTGDAGTPRDSACKVGDVVYPSGASGIPDPHSCNTCTCLDGELGCTKVGCPSECPPNSVPDRGCASCGPTDACEVVEHGCFAVCTDSASCLSSGHGQCLAGVCKDVCG